METSKRYSSVPVKDNSRCLYLPPIFGVGQSNDVTVSYTHLTLPTKRIV